MSPIPDRFAMSRKEIAAKLGLTFQEVRWAEESAIRKIKKAKAEMERRNEALIWDGTHDLSAKPGEQTP